MSPFASSLALVQWRIEVERDAGAQVYTGIWKTGLGIERGENAISQIRSESKELTIVDEAIFPYDTVRVLRERGLIPCSCVGSFCLWRVVSSNRKIADSEEMSAE